MVPLNFRSMIKKEGVVVASPVKKEEVKGKGDERAVETGGGMEGKRAPATESPTEESASTMGQKGMGSGMEMSPSSSLGSVVEGSSVRGIRGLELQSRGSGSTSTVGSLASSSVGGLEKSEEDEEGTTGLGARKREGNERTMLEMGVELAPEVSRVASLFFRVFNAPG